MKKSKTDSFHGVRLVTMFIALFAFAVGCQKKTSNGDANGNGTQNQMQQSDMQQDRSEAKPYQNQNDDDYHDHDEQMKDQAHEMMDDYQSYGGSKEGSPSPMDDNDKKSQYNQGW